MVTTYFEVSKVYSDALNELKHRDGFDRIGAGAWILSPFILLTERSPADFCLTLIGLTFLGKLIFRPFKWNIKDAWILWMGAFGIVTIFGAIRSDFALYSLTEALIWMRFPIFAIAVGYWLARIPNVTKATVFSGMISLVIVCFISGVELCIEGQKAGRLMWPYGDAVIGSFYAKASLCLVVLLAWQSFNSQTERNKSLSILLLSAAITFCFMTGERVNFLIITCSVMLALLVSANTLLSLLKPLLFTGLGLGGVIVIGGDIFEYRLFELFYETDAHVDGYLATINAGIVLWKDAIWFGNGVANHAKVCMQIPEFVANVRCDNHPHHFYVQLLAETGVLGFFCAVGMIWTLGWKLYQKWRQQSKRAVPTWIVVLALFWPISGFPDFFGQWQNIFIWSGIAQAIALTHVSNSTQTRDSMINTNC